MGPLRVALTMEQCWHRVPGGTAVAALGMARALATRADVDVVGVAARHRRAPASEFAPPIPVRHLPITRPPLYDAWHRLRWPRVERATGDVDVIHATALAVPPATAPLVVTIHDLAFVHDPEHFTPRGVRFFERGMSLARRDAAVVVCPSEATARDCRAHGFERVRVVPLGIDSASVGDDAVAAVRRRYGLERPYVLWTGTIEPRKNLARLLAAFDGIDARVDLALAGPQGWNERLAPPSPERVKVLGFVGRSDLDALYTGARAFCFPSLMEGFGFPVLEAMVHGTPVVTSRGTSTEEIAGDAAVLVDPRDPEAIRAGLERVLEDDDLRRRLGHAGRERARAYSWDRTAELLVDVYRSAVEGIS